MIDTLERNAVKLATFALAIVFIWFGALKFTGGGAMGIMPLVENSPFLGWTYNVFSVTAFAAMLGIVEIIIGLLLLFAVANAHAARIGGFAGIITFLITISFMFTTPGVVPEGMAFPVLSGMPGEFLLKDIVLLAVSILVFTDGTRRLHAQRSA